MKIDIKISIKYNKREKFGYTPYKSTGIFIPERNSKKPQDHVALSSFMMQYCLSVIIKY